MYKRNKNKKNLLIIVLILVLVLLCIFEIAKIANNTSIIKITIVIITFLKLSLFS